MIAHIRIEDKGAQTVAFDMDITIPDAEKDANTVTSASVIVLAVKAMFNNGMLAEAGAHALTEAAKGIPPEASIRSKYDNAKP